jgi:hypothetical protein
MLKKGLADCGCAIAIAAAAAVMACAGAGLAQKLDKVKAGLAVWKASGCSNCHGPFADGNNQNDDWPRGANLRVTALDAAALKLTIGCGRPGTGMPSFDEGAYAARACYGRPLGEAPPDLFPALRKIGLGEIDAVIAYLQASIIGRGEITRAECIAYYDGYNAEACEAYK